MKTSLTELKLPDDKLQELQSITDTIVSIIKPAMVILFGSYSRGNWVEDSYKENGTTVVYKSDYDILVVTEKAQDAPPRLGKEIRRRIKKAENLQTPPHIIFHDITFLNKELEEGHYFFADIVKEGTMLYNAGKFELAIPRELSAKDRQHKAELHFHVWLDKADKKMKMYTFAKSEKMYSEAAFELHQATENLYKTIELVFTNYKSKTHDLHELNRIAGYQDARFKMVFPNQTEEEKRLFEILVRAYIDSRYKIGYTVAPEDLQWLAERVNMLKDLTKSICEEKIKSFDNV